jgi:hypothetical protein
MMMPVFMRVQLTTSTKIAPSRAAHMDANASVQRLSFIPSSIILQLSMLISASRAFVHQNKPIYALQHIGLRKHTISSMT